MPQAIYGVAVVQEHEIIAFRAELEGLHDRNVLLVCASALPLCICACAFVHLQQLRSEQLTLATTMNQTPSSMLQVVPACMLSCTDMLFSLPSGLCSPIGSPASFAMAMSRRVVLRCTGKQQGCAGTGG